MCGFNKTMKRMMQVPVGIKFNSYVSPVSIKGNMSTPKERERLTSKKNRTGEDVHNQKRHI